MTRSGRALGRGGDDVVTGGAFPAQGRGDDGGHLAFRGPQGEMTAVISRSESRKGEMTAVISRYEGREGDGTSSISRSEDRNLRTFRPSTPFGSVSFRTTPLGLPTSAH